MATHFHGERASGHRALRRGRTSIPGQTYLITFTTYQRARLFEMSECASLVSRSLHALDIWKGTALLAWTVMPDHLHALIRLGEKETISLTVQRMKSLISARINQQTGFSQTCWQRGFHDHAIATNEPLFGFAQYIVNNPLRAGLIQNNGNYPYLWLHQQFL